MKSALTRCLLVVSGLVLLTAMATPVSAVGVPTPGVGWGQVQREIWYGNFWDVCSNRNYGGVQNALQWPGGWWANLIDLPTGPTERRTYANYKGFVIGAKNVQEPQYPDVIWPYMVGMRDGLNDGESGADILTAPPNVTTPNMATKILFNGRLSRRTFRQALPTVTVDGEVNAILKKYDLAAVPGRANELVGDEADAPYQIDVIDPSIPADVTFETRPWSRMGISSNRMWYSFVDRRNDDYMFWHWRMINDGIWGKLGKDRVDCCGGTWGTVQGVMMSLMFQWDRSSRGAVVTLSSGTGANDSIWRYYGTDYDGAKTQNMRLVYVIDGDQDPSKFNATYKNASQDDIGDPDPITGELLSAKTGGWQILHYDVSATDKNDDPAQPRTLGWTKYEMLLQTSTDGMEAKYNQMYLGYQKGGEYYPGDVQTTPGRGTHPFAAQGASWIKASNDPATSDAFWPGKILGVDNEVNDCEQQAGFGPDDMAPNDTINGIHVLGIKGFDVPRCQQIGKQWLNGEITDAQKDALVNSTIDSLFAVMRQAKAVYQAKQFGGRDAASRAEFEGALRAAIVQGKLALSPPAPATFNVNSGEKKINLSWTLNTTTGSTIAGWRLYRALANFKGDSAWAKIAELPPATLSYVDNDVSVGFSYYYYLTTFDAQGTESTMFTRTAKEAVPHGVAILDGDRIARFSLDQNAPNPFNPSTMIRLSLATAGPTRLDVYNMTGQLVRTLVDGNLSAGYHEVPWDGTDMTGKALASGTYIYRLVSGENVQVRRMTLIR